MPSKQLKALDETIAYIEEEGKTREYHSWDTDDCPLCKAFKIGHWNCSGCPFDTYTTSLTYGCVNWIRKKDSDTYRSIAAIPLPTILRFLRRFRKGYKG